MPDQNRFGKSSRSYAVDTPRERGIKAYNRNLREGLGSGRNVQRIHQARENRTLNRPPRWDQKLGRDVGTMVRDTTSPFKAALMHGADLFASGIGAFKEGERARRDDDEWTLGGDPLDITRGSDAYKYLLTQIDDPEDRRDFRREVGKNNLHWTELNEYAGDNAAGLAKKINEYNAGIRSFPKGEDTYSNFVRQGSDLEGTGMIGDAAARIARAQEEGRAGFATPAMRRKTTPLEAVTTEDDMPTGRYPFPVGMDMAPTEGISDEERAFQESLMDDTYFQENFDTETGAWRSPPRIEDVADSASRAENIAALDRIMAQDEYPMINAPAEALPPFLSGDTDWFTPEPEEEDLRGWDWLNEPVMKHYGVDRPSEEIERVWPNTPPPGYGPPPSWYQKYLDQFGFNTGYDYYNE